MRIEGQVSTYGMLSAWRLRSTLELFVEAPYYDRDPTECEHRFFEPSEFP